MTRRHVRSQSLIERIAYRCKIILVQDQSTWKAIAFVLPNTDFKRPYDLKSYVSIE